MTVYDLKPRFQALLHPLVSGCANMGISANLVTFAALLLSCVWGYFFLAYPADLWVFWSLPIVLFVRMALNAIDGMIAREHNQSSTFGMYFNEIGDIVSDLALYVPLLVAMGVSPFVVDQMAFAIILAELCGAFPSFFGGKRHYDGPMGKSDRAVAFGVIALLYLVLHTGVWVTLVVLVITMLTALSAYNRVKKELA